MVWQKILLGHGSGGKLSRQLIEGVILKKLSNPVLGELRDSSLIPYRQKLAFTTDSFVVSPVFFPGGDIGKLAVCGTVNDLVMSAAVPQFLSLGLIIEEGLEKGIFERVIDSISRSAKDAGVKIAAGDLKVVEKGACDKIFINTSGIGRVMADRDLSIRRIKPGDKIIVTGCIGEHGLAVLARRKELDFGFGIKSDCAALNGLLLPVIRRTKAVKFMRDPTRGGLATTLNEIAQSSDFGIMIDEKSIPVSARVRAASEILGIDPIFVANEGKAVLVVEARQAQMILAWLKRHPLGRKSAVIGEVLPEPKKKVILRTVFKTRRIIEELAGEQFPRIC